jgi:hypothetical protein
MATPKHASKQPTASSADPIDRARELAAAAPTTKRSPRTRARKREEITAIMEEHVSFLKRSVPLGDIERAMHSVRRLGVLVTELKALEVGRGSIPVSPTPTAPSAR